MYRCFFFYFYFYFFSWKTFLRLSGMGRLSFYLLFFASKCCLFTFKTILISFLLTAKCIVCFYHSNQVESSPQSLYLSLNTFNTPNNRFLLNHLYGKLETELPYFIKLDMQPTVVCWEGAVEGRLKGGSSPFDDVT